MNAPAGRPPQEGHRYRMVLGRRTLASFETWREGHMVVAQANTRRATTLRRHHPAIDWYRLVDTQTE